MRYHSIQNEIIVETLRIKNDNFEVFLWLLRHDQA